MIQRHHLIQNKHTSYLLHVRWVVWWDTSLMLSDNWGYLCNLKFSLKHSLCITLQGYTVLKADCQLWGWRIATYRRAHTQHSMRLRRCCDVQRIEPCKCVRWSPNGRQAYILDRHASKGPVLAAVGHRPFASTMPWWASLGKLQLK